MTFEKFFKEAGGEFYDNLPARIKILGAIEDAEDIPSSQIVTKKSQDGFEFRLAVDVLIPGLKGKRNLMVRTQEIKDKYQLHGCKHLMDTINPNTSEVTIPKGAFTFCIC
ncbi:MAG: hypothetical protein RIM99_06470 [Cyclobacteriaceae bacterium]